jgi:hypothetical protein
LGAALAAATGSPILGIDWHGAGQSRVELLWQSVGAVLELTVGKLVHGPPSHPGSDGNNADDDDNLPNDDDDDNDDNNPDDGCDARTGPRITSARGTSGGRDSASGGDPHSVPRPAGARFQRVVGTTDTTVVFSAVQSTVPRYNCADALDRTNVATFFIAIQVVAEMCRVMGIGAGGSGGGGLDEHVKEANLAARGASSSTVAVPAVSTTSSAAADLSDASDTAGLLLAGHAAASGCAFPYLDMSLAELRDHLATMPMLLPVLSSLFVTCGDVLSLLYTSTQATHSRVMREFAVGMVPPAPSDLRVSLTRRYHNYFNDDLRQAAWEVFLGKGARLSVLFCCCLFFWVFLVFFLSTIRPFHSSHTQIQQIQQSPKANVVCDDRFAVDPCAPAIADPAASAERTGHRRPKHRRPVDGPARRPEGARAARERTCDAAAAGVDTVNAAVAAGGARRVPRLGDGRDGDHHTGHAEARCVWRVWFWIFFFVFFFLFCAHSIFFQKNMQSRGSLRHLRAHWC